MLPGRFLPCLAPAVLLAGARIALAAALETMRNDTADLGW
jgi:hypothetical protein